MTTRPQYTKAEIIKDLNGISIYGNNSSGDGMGNTSGALNTCNYPLNFNGSSWDRVRNNAQGTLLASAARTATTGSPTMTNFNGKGVIVTLNVTVASGTGGLQLVIMGLEPVSGSPYFLNVSPTSITGTGTKRYVMYPGAVANATANFDQVIGTPLPRQWAVQVNHGDASSYTYSVGYSLIN